MELNSDYLNADNIDIAAPFGLIKLNFVKLS